MTKRSGNQTDFARWAAAIDSSAEEIKAAWEDLQRRGLVAVKRSKVTVSPLAMRRATSDMQRRLAAHLSGYVLTDNSYIVRQADPPGNPCILNTRIAVEHIANYFKEGWGVMDIERDLNILTREEIEAAIQYYLNHREEIERHMQRSRELYEAHAPKREPILA